MYRSIVAHQNSSINSACTLKKTEYIITGGGNDSKLILHNFAKLNSLVEFPKFHSKSVNAIDTFDNTSFISASSDKLVQYDIIKKTPLREYNSSDKLLDTKFISDTLIVSCGESHQLGFTDLKQSQKGPVFSISLGDDNLNLVSYDNSYMISAGCSNGSIYHLDLRNQQVLSHTFKLPVVHVKYNLRSFMCLLSNGDIRLMGLNDNRYNSTLMDESEFSYKSNFILCNSTLITSTPNGTIKVWDSTRSGRYKIRMSTCIEPHSRSGGYLQLHLGNNCLIATAGDGKLYVWDDLQYKILQQRSF